MDPDATLLALRELSASVLARSDSGEYISDDTLRLAELFQALDQWIRGGGFLPDAWVNR